MTSKCSGLWNIINSHPDTSDIVLIQNVPMPFVWADGCCCQFLWLQMDCAMGSWHYCMMQCPERIHISFLHGYRQSFSCFVKKFLLVLASSGWWKWMASIKPLFKEVCKQVHQTWDNGIVPFSFSSWMYQKPQCSTCTNVTWKCLRWCQVNKQVFRRCAGQPVTWQLEVFQCLAIL